MAKPEMIVKGANGEIELYPDRIRILRKGVTAFLTAGRGDKDILISNISAVQFKTVDFFHSGFIQFSFMGGKEHKGPALDAWGDENGVMFSKKQQPDFERLRAILEKRMHAAAPSSGGGSGADEIAKLAALRDQGILTEGEFQQKKKQLLGL